MPIYEYACQECGHRFEKLIRNQAEVPQECPACAKAALKKLFSSFSASVAGSGFCKSADACAAGAGGGGGGHVHSGGCCGSGGKCPF